MPGPGGPWGSTSWTRSGRARVASQSSTTRSRASSSRVRVGELAPSTCPSPPTPPSAAPPAARRRGVCARTAARTPSCCSRGTAHCPSRRPPRPSRSSAPTPSRRHSAAAVRPSIRPHVIDPLEGLRAAFPGHHRHVAQRVRPPADPACAAPAVRTPEGEAGVLVETLTWKTGSRPACDREWLRLAIHDAARGANVCLTARSAHGAGRAPDRPRRPSAPTAYVGRPNRREAQRRRRERARLEHNANPDGVGATSIDAPSDVRFRIDLTLSVPAGMDALRAALRHRPPGEASTRRSRRRSRRRPPQNSPLSSLARTRRSNPRDWTAGPVTARQAKRAREPRRDGHRTPSSSSTRARRYCCHG